VELLLLQFSPQLEEMETFAAAVIGRGSGLCGARICKRSRGCSVVAGGWR